MDPMTETSESRVHALLLCGAGGLCAAFLLVLHIALPEGSGGSRIKEVGSL